MSTLNLDKAQSIIEFALNWRKENGLNPLTVAVLNSAGVLIALAREDGASNLRPEIAQGKARGAISMGIGSRALFNRAQEQPYFCLLYTSPSPRDRQKSRMPSSA